MSEFESESESYSLTYNSRGKHYDYNRTFHVDLFDTKSLISDAYSSPHSLIKSTNVIVTTSGMNAISLAIKCCIYDNKFEPINIIYSDELYCDSPRTINYIDMLYGVSKVFKFNVLDCCQLISDFDTKYKNKVNILFLESCSNPNGKIFNMDIIPKLRKLSKKLYVIVDNTWLTHITFNPFKYDVDIIVCSASKHYSFGKCIGGFIVCKSDNMAKNISQHIKMDGLHISLPYCRIINQEIPRMKSRIEKAYNNTLEIANFLSSKKQIILVNYPMLPEHPSNKLAKQYFEYGPSILVFRIALNKIDTLKWMAQFPKTKLKTSFGAHDSKLDPWPSNNNSMTDCRLSIGCDTAIDDLKKELNIMLSKLK